MKPNPVKKALAEGKVQYGTNFGQIRSQEVVKILSAAGFRWAFIDTEHGGFDLETVQEICRIAPFYDFAPIVRVADLQYPLVTRALDVGAPGIIFPRVESPELLEKAVSWTKFPPRGVRGFGLTPFNFNFEPMNMPQMMEYANANTMVVLQIETVRAFEAREELLSVPGIDAMMVGPSDLSISLGVPGDFTNPRLVDAVEKIRDSCVNHGVFPGIQNRTVQMAKFWKERGMLFLGCGSETSMLFEKAKEIVAQLEAQA